MIKRFARPLLWVGLTVLFVLAAMAALVALMEHKSGALPDVKLKTLDEEVITLEQIADGKPMVVNIWATWCPPCIREMPLLQQAQKANPDIAFVFVNQGEHSETVNAFLDNADLDLTYVLLDNRGQLAQVTASMALPTTLFYNAEGEQADVHRGELTESDLSVLLGQILQP
ncbi:TlpA family protein disulfide reductase [Oceanospirillum sp.]|uniref:TlpA family protein disulfide reductase n=1 Tax=Oceanospirillum sp. TaxID=2021254 RepID=UPI003A8D43BE